MADEGTELSITSLVEPTRGTCPACSFDSMVLVRLFHLHSQGISEIATSTLCARCAAEEDGNPHGEAYP